MSNDLISRRALIDEIRKNENVLKNGLSDDAKFAYATCDSFVRMVERQPMAYNLDKVVERLEKKALKMSTAKPPHTYMKAIGTHEAIKIVKSGGVKE